MEIGIAWHDAMTGKPYIGYMAQVPQNTILTIGHSNHAFEAFLALLRGAQVAAVADVRSSPFSRRFPQFNRNRLEQALPQAGIAYLFLGEALGGRPKDASCYPDGVMDYEKRAKSAEFAKGLDRLLEDAEKYRVAVMCAERDPLDCHRFLLVARALAGRGIAVEHILANGEIMPHAWAEDRLLELSGRHDDDLFAPREERLAAAYRERGRKIAFPQPPSS